jgi:ATPase subunit of ABC transporter with duplicated ATPase domains
MHKPLRIEKLALSFPGKELFEDFSAVVQPGARISVIGRNGSGKSCILKLIAGLMEPCEGRIIKDKDAVVAFVPQTIVAYGDLSGGQRFNKALTAALAQNPDILLLDEPSNHLDRKNRASLMLMLKHYPGTVIMVSHDGELLKGCAATLWDIDGGGVNIFNGGFDNYLAQRRLMRASLEAEINALDKEMGAAHKALMREQQRAKNSRVYGKKSAEAGRWAPIIAGGMKRRAQITAGAKKHDIAQKRREIGARLASLRLPEIIKPKFSITAAEAGEGAAVLITNGACGYGGKIVLKDINFSLGGRERCALEGANASGKTTFLRAVMGEEVVTRTGDWLAPKPGDIGYLDQHYGNLDLSKTVLQSVKDALPGATYAELRDFLNDFLFRSNEEISAPVAVISGGERARLSLALIAAKPPKLLILDEVTNNIDYETRRHIVEVIKAYPAALIAVSHEHGFLEEIETTKTFGI